MRVRVYEHLTASGPDDGGSMYREGRAMRDALAADLSAIPGVDVVETNPDLAFVIAPETDGVLEERVAFFRRDCAVVAPSADALALTGDKLRLAEHWSRHGVPTPATRRPGNGLLGRDSVVKPRDGAGSCDTHFLCAGESIPESLRGDRFLIQDFVPGRSASVAFLIGPRQTIPLIPTFQRLSDDGRFAYRGGELPIPAEWAARAVALARRALECVPGLAGYVGVDLVLGDAGDAAIEINPRLTTSYIGLRSRAEFNLAAAMLALHHGGTVGETSWKTEPISFDSDGTVRPASR
jgi:tyramine---L-glutamate ligase